MYEYEENNEKRYLRGTIDKFSNIIIEFATVSNDNIKYDDVNNSLGPSSFILDNVK